MSEVFESVWDALYDEPTEVENFKKASQAMYELDLKIKETGLTKSELVKILRIDLSLLDDLFAGRVSKFSFLSFRVFENV